MCSHPWLPMVTPSQPISLPQPAPTCARTFGASENTASTWRNCRPRSARSLCPSISPCDNILHVSSGYPRFRHDPFARDMALDPGGAMAPCDSGTTHVAFGAQTASASTTSSFRGSIPYPMQSLCTLRTPRCHDARNTRYRAARYTLPGRDFHPLDHASFPGAPCGDPWYRTQRGGTRDRPTQLRCSRLKNSEQRHERSRRPGDAQPNRAAAGTAVRSPGR
jgi:hypothetical protein